MFELNAENILDENVYQRNFYTPSDVYIITLSSEIIQTPV